MQTGPTIQNSSSTRATCICQEKTPLLNRRRKRRVHLSRAGPGIRRRRKRRFQRSPRTPIPPTQDASPRLLAPGPGRAAYWRVDHGSFGRRLRGSGLRRRILGAQATDPRGLQPTPDVGCLLGCRRCLCRCYAAVEHRKAAGCLVESRMRSNVAT